MPKRKCSHGAIPSSAEVPAQNVQDHGHIKHEMVIKMEPAKDTEFDPMQSESTKVVLIKVITETKFDAIKFEHSVKVKNSFRPELLENSHEVAFIANGNERPDKENVPRKIVNKVMKTKRGRKRKLVKRDEEHDSSQTIYPVKIEGDDREMLKCRTKNHIHPAQTRNKSFKCEYCASKFKLLSGNFLK